MATLREYFENDFLHYLGFHAKIPFCNVFIDSFILYDFASFSAFLAFYVPNDDKDLQFFLDLVSEMKCGAREFTLDGKVTLPPPKEFQGVLRVENKIDFEVLARYYGDSNWVSTKSIPASQRIFIYSESNLADEEIHVLKAKARELGLETQFRSKKFLEERDRMQPPLAFICHDWRDKEVVAKKIAVNLERLLCRVWYDEFSLRVGANLRDSIEKGLKECKKCVLVLSPNFISNKGWTKTEFDSIFTRQILEEEKLVLPVWYQVEKKDVYDYSPSLLNVYGLNWEQLGEETVCRRLYSAIMNE
jgi:hypothetical protein